MSCELIWERDGVRVEVCGDEIVIRAERDVDPELVKVLFKLAAAPRGEARRSRRQGTRASSG